MNLVTRTPFGLDGAPGCFWVPGLTLFPNYRSQIFPRKRNLQSCLAQSSRQELIQLRIENPWACKRLGIYVHMYERPCIGIGVGTYVFRSWQEESGVCAQANACTDCDMANGGLGGDMHSGLYAA